MGRGQRHSKNAGIMGSEALTYQERKALGFGTVKERVGKVGGVSCAMSPDRLW
jgi:nitric oxide synthase-interacting protein